MKHKDLSTEDVAGTSITRKENRHYSFRHQHKHLWHCAWVWILIISFLTPQFSYNVGANDIVDFVKNPKKEAKDWGHNLEKTMRPVTQAVVPKSIRNQADRLLNEIDRAGYKVEKYAIRPMNDPKVIGKVVVMAVVAYVFPPGEGLVAAALAAGATSAAYDRVVFNVHNGGDLLKSALKAGGSVAVAAGFEHLPTDNSSIWKSSYVRGVEQSLGHIAVSQVSELIVEGKGTLGGRIWSGVIAGAFVPSIALDNVDNSFMASLIDPINRSVVEQSVVNRFNMKKVDFGAVVASGVQGMRDQYVKEKTTEYMNSVKNWLVSDNSDSNENTDGSINNKKRGIASDDSENKFPDVNKKWNMDDLANFFRAAKANGLSPEEAIEYLYQIKPYWSLDLPSTPLLANLNSAVNYDENTSFFMPGDPYNLQSEIILSPEANQLIDGVKRIFSAIGKGLDQNYENYYRNRKIVKHGVVGKTLNVLYLIAAVYHGTYNEEPVGATIASNLAGIAVSGMLDTVCWEAGMAVGTPLVVASAGVSGPVGAVGAGAAVSLSVASCFESSADYGDYVTDYVQKYFKKKKDDENRQKQLQEKERIRKELDKSEGDGILKFEDDFYQEYLYKYKL